MTQPKENPKPKEERVSVAIPRSVGGGIHYTVTSSAFPSQHGALFNVKWIDSAEYKSYAKMRNIIVAIAIVLGILLCIGLAIVLSDPRYYGGKQESVVFMAPATLAIFMGAVAIAVRSLHRNKKQIFRDRYISGLAKEIETEESKVAAQAAGGKLELPELWAATQTRIGYYHEIATTQAEQSFRVGIAAAIAGFVAVIALGIVAAFAANGTAAIAASVVGVAGAAMSAYIGATFMKTQSQASDQLSKFFLQPVEFSRLLGAERLLQTLPPEQRAEAVSTIVKSMMPGPTKEASDKEETKP